MDLKAKIALLKKHGIKVDENATEQEVDKLIEENADVVETTEDKVEEITEAELNEKIAKGVETGFKSFKQDLDAIKAQVNKTAKEVLNEGFEKGLKFIKGIAGIDKDFDFKAVTTNVNSFGYTIPTEVADAVLEKRDALVKMRKYAFVFKMAGKFQLPKEGTAVTSYWVGDNEEVTESNPTIIKADLDDYYLATRVLIPRKLLNTTAINVINYIANLSSRSLAQAEETAFVAGAGSTQPTGLRTASITGIAQASTSFAYDDLVNLFYGLPEQYRANAVFMTSSAGMKLIRKLKDTVGLPIFDPSTSTIWGKPVLESSNIPANLGSGTNETEILFGDLSYYWIKDGEDLTMLSDTKNANLQIELVLYEAVDGVLTLTDAFRKLTGVK